jgi:hypothetical protein
MYCKRETSGAPGWLVQVHGKPNKFFSDKKHGGKAGALRKAARLAQRLADKSRVNPYTGRFVRDPAKTRGVYRMEVKGRPYWIANARLQPGKETQRRFSVGKYGEAEAEKLALEARARMVKELLRKPK